MGNRDGPWLDSSGFCDNKTRTVDRKRAKVGDMEGGHEPILSRVHAHWCDDHSVGDRHILDCEWLKKQWDLVCTRLGGVDGSKIGTGGGRLFDEKALLWVAHELLFIIGGGRSHFGAGGECSCEGGRDVEGPCGKSRC